MSETRQLLPYRSLEPMTEGVRTGRNGETVERWELRTWGGEEEAALVRRMLAELGSLDDKSRKIRAHIGSFSGCDSGVPATIDELLEAIGRGELHEPALRNGCDHSGFLFPIKGTQPRQMETMKIIEEVLAQRLADKSPDALLAKFPWAEGFILRTYEWLPPASRHSRLP